MATTNAGGGAGLLRPAVAAVELLRVCSIPWTCWCLLCSWCAEHRESRAQHAGPRAHSAISPQLERHARRQAPTFLKKVRCCKTLLRPTAAAPRLHITRLRCPRLCRARLCRAPTSVTAPAAVLPTCATPATSPPPSRPPSTPPPSRSIPPCSPPLCSLPSCSPPRCSPLPCRARRCRVYRLCAHVSTRSVTLYDIQQFSNISYG